MEITYLKGDATNPVGEEHRIIVHICNDLGRWGKGFVLAISKRWKKPEELYKASFKQETKPKLGEVQFVDVEPSVTVANIIGQHGIRSPRNKTAPPPIRYDAVRDGLRQVADYAKQQTSSVHMPRIGCGLAGGTWEEIEPIITETLIDQGISVYVYDF